MQEAYVQQDMFTPQEQAERRRCEEVIQHVERRRIDTSTAEQTFDFSQVDFTRKDVREALARACRELLSYLPRRIDEQS